MKFRHGETVLVSAIVVLMMLSSFSSAVDAQGTSTNTPIKHLVILMMENHSFDNLFGVYGMTENGTIEKNLSLPENLLTGNLTSNLSSVPNGVFSTSNPYEGYSNYHTDWNNGHMNGFINGSGPSSMTYFTASQMGPEWMIAQQYAMGDMYFSEMLSMTLPNRLFSISGFTPLTTDQSPPPYVLYSDTIFSELDSHGVSWGYYFQNPSLGEEPLNLVYGIGSHAADIGTWNDFVKSIQSGTLPDITWVSPISGGTIEIESQHPPFNVLIGELWILYIVHLIMESSYWSSTAIMITYDEGGGYYDQVAPPVIGGEQLGFRVPFILISPYAKEGYVSHTVMSHTSILGFIDYNWNMPALNKLVLDSNLPLDMFNFNQPYSTGNIARPPMAWNRSQLALIPNSLVNSTNKSLNYSNVGDFFPVGLQYPVSDLPYASSGSSTFNLSQISSNVYISNETGYYPVPAQGFSLSTGVLLGAVAAVAGSSAITAYFIWKRRRL